MESTAGNGNWTPSDNFTWGSYSWMSYTHGEGSACLDGGASSVHPAVMLFLVAAFGLTILVSGVGDTLLVYIILSNRRLRSVTNLMIANLAVSDALTALLSAPFTLHYYLTESWAFGRLMCPLVGTVKNVSLYVSVNTLFVIGIDRFVGIFNPLRPRMGKGTLFVIVSCVWVFSILIALPTPLNLSVSSGFHCGREVTVCSEFWYSYTSGRIYMVVITVMEFILPAVAMAVVYGKIAAQLWFHRHPPGHETPRHREITLVRKQKIIPMLITVVVAFFVCWCPYYAFNLAWHFDPFHLAHFSFQYSLYYIVESVAMLNAVISTVIYFVMSPVFKEEFWCLLFRCCPSCRGSWGRRGGGRAGLGKSGSQQASRTGSGFTQTTRNGLYHSVPKTCETAEARL